MGAGLLLFVEIAVVAVLIALAAVAGNVHYEPRKRTWLDGIAAAVFAALIISGAAAGSTRMCMPSLDWGIFVGQMELRGIFGAVILPILVLPAFVVAWRILPKRDLFGAFVLLAYIVAISAYEAISTRNVQSGAWTAACLFVPAVVGALYSQFSWMRRFGVLVGIVAGSIVGAAIFATLPFGHNDCGSAFLRG